MQFKDPTDVELLVNGKTFKGIIEGTPEGVKFKSNDPNFFDYFSGGEFDSLDYDGRKITMEQRDIINAAKKEIMRIIS